MSFSEVFWKKYVQYQKPQADLLLATCLPLAAGVYNFGWRVLLCALIGMGTAWLAEYAFTRLDGKPVSTAGLVTGMLSALILPPNIPFWQIAVGCAFAVVFGKMVFGGFGKNVFNPAMVGRCFLYICFPATMAASWFVPHTEGFAGLGQYSTTKKVMEADLSLNDIDGITSATTLTAVKRLNITARQEKEAGNFSQFQQRIDSFGRISLRRLFLGNINGCMGETSALMILIALAFLIYRKVVAVPLVIAPLLGMAFAKLFTGAIGADVLPLGQGLLINYLGGGTMFAVVFMTTEPISAPLNPKARWLYGILIGFLGSLIRSMSAFNAGLMFAILLGNMFGPLLEIGCEAFDKRGREVKSS
jgi:Na+-transporting NADH:ubiquinone oxidoreductase subunit B